MPHAAHGTHRGVVVLPHLHITCIKQAVHTLVGIHGRVAKLSIAVLAAPSHEKHRLATRIVGVDGIHQLLCKRKHIQLNRIQGEGRKLALLLHHHEIPAAFANQCHRLVVAMHLESATARRIAAVFQAFAHALRHVGHHLRKTVDLGVAIADEQHARPFLCRQHTNHEHQ